jgi:hypothetical protein
MAGPTFSPILLRSAEAVARAGYRGLRAGKRLVVPGLPNKAVAALAPMLPRRPLLAATAREQKKRRS